MIFVITIFFFFSSRRRHTRFKCDWSSDVCSSDLGHAAAAEPCLDAAAAESRIHAFAARSEERREGKSVDLGGRRIIKKKTSYVVARYVIWIAILWLRFSSISLHSML